jgi:hypothetical protein
MACRARLLKLYSERPKFRVVVSEMELIIFEAGRFRNLEPPAARRWTGAAGDLDGLSGRSVSRPLVVACRSNRVQIISHQAARFRRHVG